jgi:cyclophilin family peptidyl-prolyl cis-trans isomerase
MAEVAARTQDLVPFPRTALALAETLIAANRPDEAKTMFDGMRTVFAERPDLAGRAKTLGQRIDALTPLFFIERNQRTIDAQKDELPRVELVTSKGAILVELFAQQAPNSAEAFLSFVEKNLYAGTKFHRRIPGLALFGGDPNTKVGATGRPGFGSPGFRLPDEGRRSDRRLALGGTIGFAKALTQAPQQQPGQPPLPRAVENSAGATFFILLAPAEFLHDEFTIVGRILEGMEVVAELGPSDEIVSAKIVRAGNRIQQLATSPELPTPLELTILESGQTRQTAEITRGRGPLPPGARGLPAPGAPGAPAAPGAPTQPNQPATPR